jgi:hypothetical protein
LNKFVVTVIPNSSGSRGFIRIRGRNIQENIEVIQVP